MMNKRRLRQISDRTWVVLGSNRGIQPNVGIIVDESQTILVDCGNSPAWGRVIQEFLDYMEAPPVSHIIYTHHHWDHIFGAISFDAKVIAHEKCLGYLKEEAEKPWGPACLQAEMEKDSRLRTSHEVKLKMIDNWGDFSIVLPQITFTDKMTLQLSESELYLEHAGGNHSDDSILVCDEKDQVLFSGDAFYPPPFHERTTDLDGAGFSEDVLRQILSHQVRFIVHGHGMPLTRSDLIKELNLPEEEKS